MSLISEEFSLHNCQRKIVDIKYKWLVNTQLDDYGEVLIIEGQDGTLYRVSPDEKLQRHNYAIPDEDDTEPYARFCNVSVCLDK